MKVKGWEVKTKNREEWWLIVLEAKVHPELQRRGEGRKDIWQRVQVTKLLNYAIFFSFHLFRPSSVTMFSSTSRSRIPSACVLLSICVSKCKV
jgi:hypothetical protein